MASLDSFSRWPNAASAAKTDRLERLGALFVERLQRERVYFSALRAELARAKDTPGTIIDALQFRAHRLKGAAAIFEFPELGAAAGRLEDAALAAAGANAAHGHDSVWDALVALVQLLGDSESAAPNAQRAVLQQLAPP